MTAQASFGRELEYWVNDEHGAYLGSRHLGSDEDALEWFQKTQFQVDARSEISLKVVKGGVITVLATRSPLGT